MQTSKSPLPTLRQRGLDGSALLLEEADAALKIVGMLLALVACFVAIKLAWRRAGRSPVAPLSGVPGTVAHSRFHRFNGAGTVLDRLGFRPGQEVLEIGPGRPLTPAASRPGAV